MNYGFMTAASGALTQMARLDVLSNNLANAETPGFKPLGLSIRARDAVRQEDGLGYVGSDRLLERLGAGVMPTPTAIGTGQGGITETNNPLDVALEGEGYLMVRIDDPEQSIGLTRDGRLLTGPNGVLVHAASGRPVLSPAQAPIELEPGLPVNVRDDGVIVQGGVAVAQLGVITIPEPHTMRAHGHGAHHPTPEQMEQALPSAARVRGRAIEQSAVNPISTMMSITRAGGSARSNLTVASIIGSVMDVAISQLGRVS
ncbi:MAG: flagellar hook basal-body protein [Planctomycetota bacterium]